VERLVLTPSVYQPQAVSLLSLYPKDKASPVLLAALKAKESMVKTAALRTLVNIDAPESRAAVRDALSAPDNGLRAEAVLLCAGLKSPDCFPILLKMGDDPDPLVRRYLASPLAAYKRPEAIPILLKLLHDPDPDPYIRVWAASSLGGFGRKDGVPVLLQLLSTGKDKSARGSIYSALEDITGKKFRQDPDEWLRWWENETRKAESGNHRKQP
jgi:HEAT repeat protein